MSKKRQPIFTIASILLTLVAVVIFLLGTMVEPFNAYWIPMFAGGLVLLISAWGVYYFGERSAKPTQEEEKEKVITVIGCKNCDVREERAFAEGDYVRKEIGPCKKCSGTSVIKAIYAVSLKKE